ncbi:MAG: helix-turn-helix transcriptional regulator [Dehalococcoidia bacterium]
MAEWTFLTNHSHVLICIMQNPNIRLSEIAERVGITQRTAFAIVTDLVDGGYVSKVKQGRRNAYEVHPELPFRHPIEGHSAIRALFDILEPASAPAD